ESNCEAGDNRVQAGRAAQPGLLLLAGLWLFLRCGGLGWLLLFFRLLRLRLRFLRRRRHERSRPLPCGHTILQQDPRQGNAVEAPLLVELAVRLDGLAIALLGGGPVATLLGNLTEQVVAAW